MPYVIVTKDKPNSLSLRVEVRATHLDYLNQHKAKLLAAGAPPRGMPLRIKVEAVLLHLSGLSMNRTAKLLGVSTPSVQAWIERFAEVYARKPEPEGRAVVVELDEMWHFLKKSPASSGG